MLKQHNVLQVQDVQATCVCGDTFDGLACEEDAVDLVIQRVRSTSPVTPHTSHLTPHTSHLTPYTSSLTPHTSHTSHLTRHTGQSNLGGVVCCNRHCPALAARTGCYQNFMCIGQLQQSLVNTVLNFIYFSFSLMKSAFGWGAL